jgi:hypothetical protein
MTTPTAAPPVPMPKRSRRRWVLLGAFALLSVAVPTGYMLIAGWLRDRELEQIYAEIDADDPNWRWPDLIAESEPVPDDQNAFVQIRKVHGMLKITPFAIAPAWYTGPNDRALNVRNARLSAENAEMLRAAFKPLDPKLMSEARKLKDLPRGRIKMDPSLNYFEQTLGDLQPTRDIIHLLESDVMLRLHDNDMEGAAESWQAMVNTTHAIADSPSLVGQLVRMAGQAIAVAALERLLGQGELSEPELAKIQSLLEREQGDNALAFGMRGERAAGQQLYQDVRDGKTTLSNWMNGIRGGTPPPNFGDRALDLFHGFFLKGYPEYLRLMNEQVKASKLPEHERAEAMKKIDQQVRDSRNRFVRMTMPGTTKVGGASQRTQATLRSALVAVTAERYRLKGDAWPRGMDDLIQMGLLKEVPSDPYDGKPLRFKRTPTGVVIYSVAGDKIDNQGNLDRALPGTDLGFELWDRQLRAVAPPAEEEP